MVYEKVFDNVFLVNNTAIQHENVNFIFSTLRSKISISNKLQIENGMSDFQVIKIYGKSCINKHMLITFVYLLTLYIKQNVILDVNNSNIN